MLKVLFDLWEVLIVLQDAWEVAYRKKRPFQRKECLACGSIFTSKEEKEMSPVLVGMRSLDCPKCSVRHYSKLDQPEVLILSETDFGKYVKGTEKELLKPRSRSKGFQALCFVMMIAQVVFSPVVIGGSLALYVVLVKDFNIFGWLPLE